MMAGYDLKDDMGQVVYYRGEGITILLVYYRGEGG